MPSRQSIRLICLFVCQRCHAMPAMPKTATSTTVPARASRLVLSVPTTVVLPFTVATMPISAINRLQRNSSSKRRKVSGKRRFTTYVSSGMAMQKTAPSVQAMSEKSSPGKAKMVSTSMPNIIGIIIMPGKKRRKANSRRALRPMRPATSTSTESRQNAVAISTSMLSRTEMSRTKSVSASQPAISVDDCKIAPRHANPMNTIAATAVMPICRACTNVCFSTKLKQTSIKRITATVSIVFLFGFGVATLAHDKYQQCHEEQYCTANEQTLVE